MKNIILGVVQSEFLKEKILEVQERFPCPVKFREKLKDYPVMNSGEHVGLLILEYDLVRNMNEKERKFFYKMKCPFLIITHVANQYYLFPLPMFAKLGSENRLKFDEISRIVNEYFRPLSSGSHLSLDEETQFVTQNTKMLSIFENAKRAAQYNTNILLLGESGTGKDVLANLIHKYSKRSERHMVKLNCAAIPKSLLETELFGYRKGAFTDAYQDKLGKIELANGSSLFLNEIAELDYELQAKLLRVIESGEVDVIGGLTPVKVDVRLISATNQDIRKAVIHGKFREDLFYRLNVICFQLIPLRDRLDDLPLLVNHFIAVFNRKYHKNVKPLNKEFLGKMYEYHWPGNVRELRNFVHRLVMRAPQSQIKRELINNEIENLSWDEDIVEEENTLKTYLEKQEQFYIQRVLAKTEHKVLDAAEELGISRSSLFRKMKKYGINTD